MGLLPCVLGKPGGDSEEAFLGLQCSPVSDPSLSSALAVSRHTMLMYHSPRHSAVKSSGVTLLPIINATLNKLIKTVTAHQSQRPQSSIPNQLHFQLLYFGP